MKFNPMQLPQLLEKVGCECFSDLEGTYVQIPATSFSEEVTAVRNIFIME